MGKNTSGDIFVLDHNIGIGTDNPTTQLDISGNLNVQNDATVKGNSCVDNPTINSYEIITGNSIMDNSKLTCLINIQNSQVDISMNSGVDGATNISHMMTII